MMISLLFSFFLYASSDLEVMQEVTTAFKKQCGYISSVEENIIRFIESKYKQAQDDVAEDSLSCFRNSVTQIGSINYIYTQICKELTQTEGKLNEDDLTRLFVGSQKYRRGIKLQHSILNDCLDLSKDGQKYIVDINHNRVKTKYLKERLSEIEPNKDFLPNRVNYR